MSTPFRLSNGPQNDRAKVTNPTGDPTGYDPAAGAVYQSKPCVVMAVYASIRETLAGTIFLQFYDSAQVVGAFANQSTYDLCSEPLITPGGTFIWQPGNAETAQYQYPRLRRSVRTCHDTAVPNGRGVPRDEPISEMFGYPMDNGLFIVASTTKTGLTLAAANLVRITAYIRSPSEQNG